MAPPARILVNTKLGFFSALSAVKPDSTEDPVSGLWTTICGAVFPMDDFRLTSKDAVLSDDTKPDCVVFQVRMRVPQPSGPRTSNEIQEKQIFMVECKRPSKDTPAEWQSAADQLNHYCEQNLNGSRKIFGATAVGTKVKFWRYSNPHLTELHQGVYDLLDSAGRDNAEQCLLYIRNNGWAWTASG